jgi:hypothetical protein
MDVKMLVTFCPPLPDAGSRHRRASDQPKATILSADRDRRFLNYAHTIWERLSPHTSQNIAKQIKQHPLLEFLFLLFLLKLKL